MKHGSNDAISTFFVPWRFLESSVGEASEGGPHDPVHVPEARLLLLVVVNAVVLVVVIVGPPVDEGAGARELLAMSLRHELFDRLQLLGAFQLC